MSVVFSSDSIKDGYTFIGWLYNGVTCKVGDPFTMPAVDVVLFAKWSRLDVNKAGNNNNFDPLGDNGTGTATATTAMEKGIVNN